MEILNKDEYNLRKKELLLKIKHGDVFIYPTDTIYGIGGSALKQKTIHEIKLYLRSKNLLKVGSEVPNDVLRQMYENAILAGDVTNKSKDTLIHNYFNDK